MADRVVTFTLANADSDEALAKVKGVPGVLGAGRIAPNSRNELGRRMAYANIAAAEAAEAVLDAIAAIEGVENAELPADRFALKRSPS
jgi:hypothetical protein